MKKACLVVDNYLTNNNIFQSKLFRDGINHKYYELKKCFFANGYDLATHDVNGISESDIVLYASGMPQRLPSKKHIDKSFLILWESEFICPANYDKAKHQNFKKIFTWNDDLVDEKKYIKINFSHSFPEAINGDLRNKNKLCVLIAGNKKSNYKLDKRLAQLDLYSEREKVIRWFESNHISDFDLYGVGWDKYIFAGPKVIRALNFVPHLQRALQLATSSTYPSYKGTVEHKKPVMEQYRFSICYENVRNIPGYITEKIFDSFFAGCVPVYWGANNIKEYIPSDCFIDMRDFLSYSDLYDFLINIPDKEYLRYIDSINNFIKSEKSNQFKSQNFAKVVVANILKIP